jgi:hypothetical protein
VHFINPKGKLSFVNFSLSKILEKFVISQSFSFVSYISLSTHLNEIPIVELQ